MYGYANHVGGQLLVVMKGPESSLCRGGEVTLTMYNTAAATRPSRAGRQRQGTWIWWNATAVPAVASDRAPALLGDGRAHT